MATTATLVQPLPVSRSRDSAAQAIILALLYALPAVWSLRALAFVTDKDIWWHLATGNWILRHAAVPRTDPFSAYGMGKSWAAYSWGFELPAAWLVAHLGLMGLLLLQCVLVTAVIVALHRLIAAVVCDFTIAVLLTLAAVVAMDGLFTPRPWLFTILFFVLELHIILRVREDRNYHRLLWLPLIYCVWANIHVQFVYGLFLPMLAAAEAWWNWWNGSADPVRRKARDIWTVTLFACVAATLLNPYFVGIYKVAYQLGTQPGVLNLISELGPIMFRSFENYLLLAIGTCAIATLAWRRESGPFPWALLLWAMLCSFRSQRDMWLLAVVGAVTIAAAFQIDELPKPRHSMLQSCCIAIGVFLMVAGMCRVSGLSSAKLQAEVASEFPAAAVEVVNEKRMVGPLFNDYNWGGYLIWSLPQFQVSMDGRAALHGTPRLERSAATWRAKHDWNSDVELQNARLVIGPVDAGLCAALRLDPRYELVFQDKLASVFVKRDTR